MCLLACIRQYSYYLYACTRTRAHVRSHTYTHRETLQWARALMRFVRSHAYIFLPDTTHTHAYTHTDPMFLRWSVVRRSNVRTTQSAKFWRRFAVGVTRCRGGRPGEDRAPGCCLWGANRWKDEFTKRTSQKNFYKTNFTNCALLLCGRRLANAILLDIATYTREVLIL